MPPSPFGTPAVGASREEARAKYPTSVASTCSFQAPRADQMSDDVVRCEPTNLLGVAGLDLQRGMGNLEAVFQLLADFVQQAIVEPRSGAHQMRRQGGFGGAHRPDMKIVDFAYAGKPVQIALHM